MQRAAAGRPFSGVPGACVLGLWVLAAWLPGVAAAGAGTLAPYRAVYAMTLEETREGSDIAAVSGRLVLEWSGSACEGYVTGQRIVSRMVSKQGNGFVSDFRVNSFETADGSDFTFSMVHYIDGELTDEIDGRAVKADGGAKAMFTKPARSTLPLPPSVVFPTEHVRLLLAAAEAGRTVLEAELFDGSETDHHFATTAFIGRRGTGAPDGGEAEPGEALADLAYWPVQISYFDPGVAAGLPEFEVSYRFYANGVSTGLRMDYGDLVIGARLMELELLPVSRC